MYLLTKEQITSNMLSANNDKSSPVNGRLRPRKPSIALPPPARSKSLRRRSEGKITDYKINQANSSKNESKLERSVIKPAPPSSLDFLCPYCDKKFASKKSVSKHVGRSHMPPTGDVACQFCSHAAAEPLQLMRHMLEAHHNRYFACLDCRTRFTSSNELKEHKINLCRKLKPPGKTHRNSLCQSKEKNDTKKLPSYKSGGQQGLEDDSDFKSIVIACELKPNQIEDPADIESNITTNLILPTNKNMVGSGTIVGKGPVLVIDDIQWNNRMTSNFSFHNSEADQILSRLGVVHRSPGAATTLPRSHTYKYIEESTKFEKCFDTVFYSKVASNVQENLEKFLDGSFNRTPLDPDSIIKTRKSKNLINTAEGFPILLSSEQFSRTAFGAYLPRSIAPRHKWKRDSIDNEKHIVSPDQLLRDSHANNCIVTLVSSLDIWTQLCMRRKFEDKYNNSSFNERKTEKQHVISKELKEILESRELPKRASSENKCDKIAKRQVEGLEFPMSLGLRPASSPPPPPPPPALLSGEWVRPRCFVCCACGDHTRDPKALVNHFNTQHPTANVSHYDIPGELLCNDDSILKHLYVPSNPTPNRTRPLRGIRECTKCGKSITLEELHQHMLECAGDTPVVKRKCRYRPFGVRRRRPRMPDNEIHKKIRRNICKRKTMQKKKIRSRSRARSDVGDAETIRKMIADLPAKRHRASESTVVGAQNWNRKRDITMNKLLRNRSALDNAKNIDKQHTQKGSKNCLKSDPKVKKKNNENTSKNGQTSAVALRPIRVASRILRKADLKRKNALRRSPRSANQVIDTHEKENPNKSIVCISSAVQTDEVSLHASSDRVDVNRSRGRTNEHAARSNSSSSTPRQLERAGDNSANANNNQQDTRPHIKHSIARLTATTVTHDKAVQFQPHFLVNQECSKSTSKPYLLSEPQVFYENDIMAARLDKPPLIDYNQTSPVDSYAFQKSKLNKPRKKLNDCIAMLKNKLVEPPPPLLPSYSMHETVHAEPTIMPLNYAPLEMMTPLNMMAECQYDMPSSIPYAHANTNAVSIISAPLDLSGKRSTNDDLLSTEYETLDLSQKNLRNSHSYYPYNIADEDVVVDLCMKSVYTSNNEESLDLSSRSKRFDENPMPMINKPCESRSIEPLPMYEYDYNATQYNNHSMFHQSSDFVCPQQALDYNLENRTIIQSIPPVYSRDLECERMLETNILSNNTMPLNVDKNVEMQLNVDHHINKKLETFNAKAPTTTLVETAPSKDDVIATKMLEKDQKENNLQSKAAVDDAAKKIALLPKEIVEILGKMPTDHRNQLLDVLPQYMGCNTSVKQLKLVVDINPEALISPMGLNTAQSASTEIATQTLKSSVDTALAAKVIDIDKHSIESAKEDIKKNAPITDKLCVTIQGPPISCGVAAQDPISLQNSGLNKDLSITHTADKPKEIKEKTASSLRAVRIKTSSQRRRTQNALEIKPTDHVPILNQPCLATRQEHVLIQQAEVSSTQFDNLKRFPSLEIGNLHQHQSQNSETVKKIETDTNQQAPIPIAKDSTCGEIPPTIKIVEHNVKEPIIIDVLPELPSKANIIKTKEARNVLSDGDSEDDVSLAVIVKLKMAERQKPLDANLKPNTPRQKKKKQIRKESNDGHCNIDIDLETNKHPAISPGMTENVSNETVTCIKDPNDYVNKIAAASDPQSFYTGKKLRTRSTRSLKKEEQTNVIEQRPVQNQTVTNFDNIQNKENNDQTHTNVDMQLTNSEHLDKHNIPKDVINEKKDNEQPLAKITQVSCDTIQDIEEIKPKEILKTKLNPKRRTKEMNVCKPPTIQPESDTICIESIDTQVKVHINIDSANINQLHTSPFTQTKEIDEIKCLSSKTSNNVEKPDDGQEMVMSENSLLKCNDKTHLNTTSLIKSQSNRNLRRSRRGKSDVNVIQPPSPTRRDNSPMLLSVSKDLDSDAKSCSDLYVELTDPPIMSEKLFTVDELNANLKSSIKEILKNVEIICEKEISICKNTEITRNKKSAIVDDSLSLKSPENHVRPEIKEPVTIFEKSETSRNISSTIIKENENTQKHNANVETISPTATTSICNLLPVNNFNDIGNATITTDDITIIEKNKFIKQKRKSKSVGERKDKNQSSKFKKHTTSVGETLNDPTPSEKPNLFVVSDINKDYLSMSPTETKKTTTCYNLPRASAVTRSKSSLSKSEDGNSTNYDPYDIDQEDNMLEKISPLKKVPSNRKIFREDFLPNKLQATEGTNNYMLKKTTTTRTSFSDSDDSSKSDVPLKKLVDERQDRKNKDNLHKLVKRQAEEEDMSSVTDAPVSTLSEDESLRSEQFMESFGFFSERRPRKSNIIAAKKISETFQNDDNHSGNERSSKKIDRRKSVSNIISADFPIKCFICSNSKKIKKGRKRRPSKDVTFSYCTLCEKAFRRPDNYLRHIMSYYHLTNVLQKEMNYEVEPIQEQPNCLVIYRQHLERLKRLSDKIKKKNKKLGITASPPKFELPSLTEIMAEAKMHTYSSPGVERRGLSRDEALFIDCCELLKESHKNEPVETVTLETVVPEEVINPIEKIIAEERADSKSDGDVDSITAKTILESEEVRNLENDLLCGLKEAAAKRHLELKNQIQSPNSQSLDNFDLDLDTEPAPRNHSSVAENMFLPTDTEQDSTKIFSPKTTVSCPEVLDIVVKKPKKSKTKVTTEIAVDIYEDKFDKIKRKCRSQAAAAKATPALTEPNTSNSRKKKSDTKKIKKIKDKNVKQNTIPTKGALKGFECIKLSESVDNASSSEPGYEITPPPSKRKKSSHSRKKERREPFKRSSDTHCSNVLPRTRADIYEFMDNDDAVALQLRRSSAKDKFKTYKDTPSTSRADPMHRAYDSSASGSDGDDFVYMSDDYLCSADETENSLLSSELSGIGKTTESKKPPKRKEALEKSAVMGKIFKNNAVRNERKPSSSSKETTKASKANLDQLFDSLLEDEPNSSMLKDADFPSINRALSPEAVRADVSAAATGSQSCDDSIFNSPPREQTTKRKKSRQNKKVKQKRYKVHVEEAMESTTHKKVKARLSGDDKVSTESTYVVAQHRARRACAVGKQNVLAESWSSESDSDSPRATAGDAALLARKKRSKKNKHSAARQPKHVSFGIYEKESEDRHRVMNEDAGGGVVPATVFTEKRNSRGRSRSDIAYFSSSEDGEEPHPQQHGWIVGNSHKKLVTMLAHAKGRKRDDKRSYID